MIGRGEREGGGRTDVGASYIHALPLPDDSSTTVHESHPRLLRRRLVRWPLHAAPLCRQLGTYRVAIVAEPHVS